MERGRDREGKIHKCILTATICRKSIQKDNTAAGSFGSLLKLRVPQSTVLEGMLWCTHRHPPNPRGVCGAEESTGRPSHPHKHAVGKQTCLPLHPSSHGQPQQGRSMCLRLCTRPLPPARAPIDFSSSSRGNSQEENDFLLSSSAGVCLAKGLISACKFYQYSLRCIIKVAQPPIVWKIL